MIPKKKTKLKGELARNIERKTKIKKVRTNFSPTPT